MSDEVKKGLLGIIVDETTISQVMPDINSLTYRGYAVQDLCEKCSFEEVAYLILNKELPTKSQFKKFKKNLEENRNITTNLREIIKHMPKKANPMDVARTVVSIMGLEDKEANKNSPESNMRKAIRIFSKTPTAIAAFFRTRKGKKIIPPKRGPVKNTIEEILGGLRSSCTYAGARTLKALPKCTTFVKVNRQLNEVYGNA